MGIAKVIRSCKVQDLKSLNDFKYPSFEVQINNDIENNTYRKECQRIPIRKFRRPNLGTSSLGTSSGAMSYARSASSMFQMRRCHGLRKLIDSNYFSSISSYVINYSDIDSNQVKNNLGKILRHKGPVHYVRNSCKDK